MSGRSDGAGGRCPRECSSLWVPSNSSQGADTLTFVSFLPLVLFLSLSYLR